MYWKSFKSSRKKTKQETKVGLTYLAKTEIKDKMNTLKVYITLKTYDKQNLKCKQNLTSAK